MKKQINPTIKAHLIRGAFYLLLLIAVCAIPFALAQRNAIKRSDVRGVSDLPHRSLSAGLSHDGVRASRAVKAPVLHVPVPALGQPSGGTCPATITQSTSQSILDGNSVACSSDGGITTTDNSYWRAFDMNTFTGGQEYDVTSVSFGVEVARSGSGTGQPLTVNLYANHGSPFPGGDWQSNLIATSGSINIPDQADTIFMVPLTATVAAGTLELVMEVMTPDGTSLGNAFFVGSNDQPETGLSYISSVACGIIDPTPIGDVGFPNDHIIFNVNGSCPGGGTPSPTPTGSPSCTPIVINGSIGTGDPTQTDKLVASGMPQTCAGGETCAIFGDPSQFRYDVYMFTNSTNATQCVDIDTNTTCSGNHNIFTAAYLGSFDPANICTNWIGDIGSFPNPDQAFQVNVPAGQVLVVVVSEYHHAGCPSYTLTITGLCGGGSPTPTPTASPTCTAGGGTPGPWTQAAPVAIDHYGGFMDSDGTFGYEGGGYSFSAADNIDTFARFDPAANTWTPLATVPDLNNAEASGVFAPNVNKLFVFGGEEVNFALVVNTTRIYDFATDSWSTGAPMPDIRAFMASGYFNGKIYLVGGYNSGSVDPSFSQVWEYDPVTDTWDTSRTDMPATLGGPGFGVINGHLYVAGGRDINNTNLSTLYDYDIAADTWTQRANLPSGTNVPASAVIGGKLWIYGGGNPFRGSAAIPSAKKQGVRVPDTTNILQIYDPATDSWTTGPSLNQIRSFPAGTDVGSTAVAVGGYTGTDTTTSVEVNVTSGGACSPTPTATATAPTATPTASATATAPTATPTASPTATAPTATPTASPTATAPTATPTATPTSTIRPTPTPRAKPTPRPAPTPGPRPTIKPSPWPPPSPTP